LTQRGTLLHIQQQRYSLVRDGFARCLVRFLSAVVLLAAVAGCTAASVRDRASEKPSASTSPSTATRPTATTSGGERDGVVKALPTLRLAETDEFGLVVRAERSNGAVLVAVDRVDSLTGNEGERAAAARGADYSNDHFEVNDNPGTRDYVLAEDTAIWRANPSEAGIPKPMTVTAWLAYLRTEQGRQAMFHFDVESGRVVGIEEQYFP
jgi:hypothetical protein